MSNAFFSNLVKNPSVRTQIIEACELTLKQEVNNKKGAVGFAIRKAYQAVGKLENGQLIRNVIDKLLNEFCEAMDPFYDEYQHWPMRHERSFEAYVQSRSEAVAKALLVVTDRERDRVDNILLVLAYNSFRGVALNLVQSSIPALAALLARYVPHAE